MGWAVCRILDPTTYRITTWISRKGDRFKSDDEAIEWVITMMMASDYGHGELVERPEDIGTCRKALFVCAKG